MTKAFAVLCMTFAVAIAAAGLSGANAGPLSGAHDALAVLKGYSTIEKAGCIFWHTPVQGGHQMVLR